MARKFLLRSNAELNISIPDESGVRHILRKGDTLLFHTKGAAEAAATDYNNSTANPATRLSIEEVDVPEDATDEDRNADGTIDNPPTDDAHGRIAAERNPSAPATPVIDKGDKPNPSPAPTPPPPVVPEPQRNPSIVSPNQSPNPAVVPVAATKPADPNSVLAGLTDKKTEEEKKREAEKNK